MSREQGKLVRTEREQAIQDAANAIGALLEAGPHTERSRALCDAQDAVLAVGKKPEALKVQRSGEYAIVEFGGVRLEVIGGLAKWTPSRGERA